jgi:hypothetical protein
MFTLDHHKIVEKKILFNFKIKKKKLKNDFNQNLKEQNSRKIDLKIKD